MAKIIDTRNAGGQLIILGDAVAIPSSNSVVFSDSSPRVAGSIRYNPDNNTLEYLSNSALSWMSLSGVDTSGFISVGLLDQYLAKSGGVMTGGLAVKTTGSANGVVFTGGDQLLTMVSTGAVGLPVGNTAQRPSSNVGGIMRWNSTLTDMEFHNGTTWVPIVGTISTVANAAIDALLVGEIKLANGSVTEIKLANSSVTEIKLANGSVTEVKLAANAVTQNKILDGAITNTKYANASITNAKLASVATQTIKGRTTSGSGAPEDLTAAQATAILSAMVGDSGSGGTKGLVPAPASGDAAASKFLAASGLWTAINTGTFTGTTDAWEGSAGPFKLKGGHYYGGAINPTIAFSNAFTTACLWVGVTPWGTGANINQLNHSVRIIQLNGAPGLNSFSAWCSWEEEVSDVFIGSTTIQFDWIAIGI
jgi:hypothetical protein